MLVPPSKAKKNIRQPDLFVNTTTLDKINKEIYFRRLWLKEFEFNSRKNTTKYNSNFELEQIFQGDCSKHLDISNNFKNIVCKKLVPNLQHRKPSKSINFSHNDEILTVEDFLKMYKTQYLKYKTEKEKLKDKNQFISEIETIKSIHLKKHLDNLTHRALSTHRKLDNTLNEEQQKISHGLDYMVSKYTHKQASKAIANMLTIPSRPHSANKSMQTTRRSSVNQNSISFYKNAANFDIAFSAILEKERKKGMVIQPRNLQPLNAMQMHNNIQQKINKIEKILKVNK